jgi:transposase
MPKGITDSKVMKEGAVMSIACYPSIYQNEGFKTKKTPYDTGCLVQMRTSHFPNTLRANSFSPFSISSCSEVSKAWIFISFP